MEFAILGSTGKCDRFGAAGNEGGSRRAARVVDYTQDLIVIDEDASSGDGRGGDDAGGSEARKLLVLFRRKYWDSRWDLRGELAEGGFDRSDFREIVPRGGG